MTEADRLVILICDDKERMRDAYCRALKKIENVEVLTCEYPDQVMTLLRGNRRIAVLLMDLEFPATPGSKGKAIIGHKYLPEIRKQFPRLKVVVVTQLGQPVYRIVLECEQKGLHDAWIDVGKIIKEDEITARVRPLIYPLGSVSRRGLWLIQMADLHFGKTATFEYWGKAEDGLLRDAVVSDVSKKMPKEYPEFSGKADLLALTGDLTENARDEQFDKVDEFIKAIAENCLNQRSHEEDNLTHKIVMIAGNHEVNYDISRARCVDVDKNKHLVVKEIDNEDHVVPELKYLKYYMWAPFERFCYKLPCVPSAFSEMWNREAAFAAGIWHFPELGAVMLGINSSANGVSHFGTDPRISPDVIRKLDAMMKELLDVDTIMPRMLMIHHSLGSSHSGSKRVNDADIGPLRSALYNRLNVRIIFTGHVHEEVTERIDVEGKAILFIGAGSVGVDDGGRPEREPLHYNLINIIPRGEADESPDRIIVYSRVSFKEEFVANPKARKLEYVWNDASGWVAQKVER